MHIRPIAHYLPLGSICTRRGLAFSALGNVIVRTPSSNRAVIWSGLTVGGSAKLRSNRP